MPTLTHWLPVPNTGPDRVQSSAEIGESLRRRLYVACTATGAGVATLLMVIELMTSSPRPLVVGTHAFLILLALWCMQWLLRGGSILIGERVVLACNFVVILVQSSQIGRTIHGSVPQLAESIFNLTVATAILAYMMLPRIQALTLALVAYASSATVMALSGGFGHEGLTVLRVYLSGVTLILLLNALAWYRDQFDKEYLQRVVLERQASTDPLTGLRNRRGLYDDIQSVLKPGRTPGSVILLDLDHFKQVNDRFGHPVGDAVLVQGGQLITTTLPSGAAVGRWGGEEFLVVLPIMTAAEAGVVAENLRQRFERYEHSTAGTVTASMGLAEALMGETMSELLSRADQALYQAKAAGRNTVVAAEQKLTV